MDIARLRDAEHAVIYGVDACDDTTRARERFTTAGRPFRYVDLETVPATRDALHELGFTSTPVIVIPDGRIEMEPSDEVLDELVEQQHG